MSFLQIFKHIKGKITHIPNEILKHLCVFLGVMWETEKNNKKKSLLSELRQPVQLRNLYLLIYFLNTSAIVMFFLK